MITVRCVVPGLSMMKDGRSGVEVRVEPLKTAGRAMSHADKIPPIVPQPRKAEGQRGRSRFLRLFVSGRNSNLLNA